MENTPTTTTTTTTKPAKVKGKPGNGLMTAGAIIAVVAIFVMIVSASTTFADGSHGGPTGGTILMLLAGGVLAAIGFCRRVLAALESRGK